jgi:hypothetical protein
MKKLIPAALKGERGCNLKTDWNAVGEAEKRPTVSTIQEFRMIRNTVTSFCDILMCVSYQRIFRRQVHKSLNDLLKAKASPKFPIRGIHGSYF